MPKKTTVNVCVQVNDETKITASRVPSSDQDFVTVKIDWDTSILLFNPAQAKALAEAADDAYYLLRNIEDEKARAERAAARAAWDNRPIVREVDPELERLLAEEEEFERRTRYTYDEPECSISDPCPGCVEAEAMYDYDEPF